MVSFLGSLLFFAAHALFTDACEHIQISSDTLGRLVFSSLSWSEILESGFFSGRGVYRAWSPDSNRNFYLYHVLSPPYENGLGRWVVNDVLGADQSAIAFVNSWSIMPHMVSSVNDPKNSKWMISINNRWEYDHSFDIRCAPRDDGIFEDFTFYLSIEGFASPHSGFYVQIGSEDNVPTFSRIRSNDTPLLYFYKRNNSWIISEQMHSDMGLGFVSDNTDFPSLITSNDWRFSSNNNWHQLPTLIYFGNESQNVFTTLRQARSQSSLPVGQKFFKLRNGVVMPAVGLGTGGIPIDIMQDIFLESHRIGYRLYDLAREYHNENILGRFLNSQIPRNEAFIISKVWPTHLGFRETSNEIILSTLELKSSYVDMYLLHWPFCDQSVDWMHCEDTQNVNATWAQSWRALEKAYAEGIVLSIGVSNFDHALLLEMDDHAMVIPHAVQNHADLSHHDIESRVWCAEHSVVFIPYATGRQISDLPEDLKMRLRTFATRSELSENAVVSLFFLSSGTAVIPRSTNFDHLVENLKISSLPLLTDEELSFLGWDYLNEHQEL
jgi:2,5-diketo-D-gluconate reductase A